MQFSQIIGQSPLKNKLVELVQHNRLSHALLFLGKEGNGALSLAIALAQYIVCEKTSGLGVVEETAPSLFGEAEPALPPAPLMDSCGVCPACQKAQQLIHPDIHFSYPTVTRKPGEKPIATMFASDWREFIKQTPHGNSYDWIESIKEKDNSQGKITAEECNDIIRKLSMKSFESGYKVLVMWMPEMLGAEGNKLLKLIEEPPPATLFILVTENEANMLQTIVSRCQLIKVPALETSEIEQALIQRNNSPAATARQVASISEGNYREALQLLQHTDEDWVSLLKDWLNAILKTGPIAQTKWVEEVSRLGREKQKQFLRYFNHLLEQALHVRVTEEASGATTIEYAIAETEKDFAQKINKITTIEQQQAIIEEIDKAAYYIERNANGKMLFHALTIKLYHIIKDNVVVG